VLAFFFVLYALSSIALPGLNGFAGEFLLLVGMFQRGWAEASGAWVVHYRIISVLAVVGVVLGAWYMLWLVQRLFFGPLREPKPGDKEAGAAGRAPVRDLSLREIVALGLPGVFLFWIGLQPAFFLERMNPTVDGIADRGRKALHSPPFTGSAENDPGVREAGSDLSRPDHGLATVATTRDDRKAVAPTVLALPRRIPDTGHGPPPTWTRP
jgi:formate hydrogenlyase subunit 3/multisubunit Na+/H+ antiporter MnhD subunit